MITRRILITGAGGFAAAAILGAQGRGSSKAVFKHELPDLTMKGWSVTAVEVSYGPGDASASHSHPGDHDSVRAGRRDPFEGRRWAGADLLGGANVHGDTGSTPCCLAKRQHNQAGEIAGDPASGEREASDLASVIELGQGSRIRLPS